MWTVCLASGAYSDAGGWAPLPPPPPPRLVPLLQQPSHSPPPLLLRRRAGHAQYVHPPQNRITGWARVRQQDVEARLMCLFDSGGEKQTNRTRWQWWKEGRKNLIYIFSLFVSLRKWSLQSKKKLWIWSLSLLRIIHSLIVCYKGLCFSSSVHSLIKTLLSLGSPVIILYISHNNNINLSTLYLAPAFQCILTFIWFRPPLAARSNCNVFH